MVKTTQKIVPFIKKNYVSNLFQYDNSGFAQFYVEANIMGAINMINQLLVISMCKWNIYMYEIGTSTSRKWLYFATYLHIMQTDRLLNNQHQCRVKLDLEDYNKLKNSL